MKNFSKSEKDVLIIKKNLREAIYKSGLNITKVAEKLGMSQCNLSHILNPNKNATVSVYIVLAICEITHTNVHAIIPNRFSKPKKPKSSTKIKMSRDNDKFVMLSGDHTVINGQTVYRIKALQEFGIVKEGELGGYIAKESNLSFKEGSLAWVAKEAVVMDDASVLNHAHVTDHAIVTGTTTVKDCAIVGGNAEINGNCFIMKEAVVTGAAKLNGKVVVTDTAIVMEDASLNGEIRAYGEAILSGDTEIEGNADIGFNIENNEDFILYENPIHPGHVITASTTSDYMCVHNFDTGTRISGGSEYVLMKIRQLYPILESLDGKDSPLGIGTVVDVDDNRKYNYDMQTFYVNLIKQHKMASTAIRRKRAGV